MLTNHLASLATPTPYSAAISHPFLTAAASLSLPAPRLALYLYQDRIYAAQAYPRFIAQLISKIPLDNPNSTELATRTLILLVGCLTNIVSEVAFFDSIARTYDIPLDLGYWRERKPTRDYTAEMAKIGALASLEDGLVFLWAMEKVYLDAWSNVYNALPEPSLSRAQADITTKAIRDLSYNWSNANPDFVQFVQSIGDLVDSHFTPAMAGQSMSGQNGSEPLSRAETIWARVVELEAEFWPNEGEEDTFRVSK